MARFANTNFILSALATIALTTLGAFFLPYGFSFPRTLEFWTEDLRHTLIPQAEAQNADIVLVTITEETLERFSYRQPVDRKLLADLLSNIAQAAPRAVGLYLPLTDRTEFDKDARLKQTLQSMPVPIVVATPAPNAPLTAKQAETQRDFLQGIQAGQALLGKDKWGGTVRWIEPGRRTGSVSGASFAAQFAKTLSLASPERRVRLAYHGVPNENTRPFLTIPAHQATRLPGKWFAGKVVLIGLDLPSRDRHRPPHAILGQDDLQTWPGVAFQAHAIAQLIEGRRVPGTTEFMVLLVTFGFCAVGVALALPVMSPLARAAAVGGGLAAFMLLALLVFWFARAPIPVVMPAFGYLGAFWLTRAAVLRFARSKRADLRNRFRESASAATVRRIASAAESIKLDGEMRSVTILATNLTGFSRTAAALDPEDAVSVLSGCIDGICETIKAHDGIIDQVAVDRVVAIFGAPFDMPDHASRAIRCALGVDEFAEGYRERRMTRTGRIGATRIGLHTGQVLLGNYGGDALFAYGAHGDAMRMASRLESANKQLGTRICASAETARTATDVIFRPVGRLRWPGDPTIVEAFEPLTENRSETPEIEAYIRAYRLVQREDAVAAAEVDRAVKIAPNDPLPKLYQRRLSQGMSGTVITLAA